MDSALPRLESPPVLTPAQAYDQVAYSYDSTYRDLRSQAENQYVRFRLPLPLQRPILDLGCGTGLALDLWPSIGAYEYTGIDLSGRMIERARSANPEFRDCFDKADMETYRPRRIPGTILCLFGALCYADPVKTLAAIQQYSDSGTRLFLMAYALGHPGSKVLREFGLATNYRRYSAGGLLRLIHDAGMQCDWIDRLNDFHLAGVTPRP